MAQNTHIWNNCRLRWQKSLLMLFLTFGLMTTAWAQQPNGKYYAKSDNLPNYDNRWLHYGFAIGMHSSNFRIQYSDRFTTPEFDSLQSVMAANSFGFSLGLIANFRLADYLDIRVVPEVVFYENRLDYRYIQNGMLVNDQQVVESTFIEIPILFKYKSVRRGNHRMYLIGGVEAGIEATGRDKGGNESDRLLTESTNFSLQAGFGMDVYFPLFKFAPEVRYSRGITNVLSSSENRYSRPLNQVATNTITLYLLFE
ncbi:MAG: porin family protein [Bacteroidota bacterium]